MRGPFGAEATRRAAAEGRGNPDIAFEVTFSIFWLFSELLYSLGYHGTIVTRPMPILQGTSTAAMRLLTEIPHSAIIKPAAYI